MNILYVAAEGTPFAKTGGLADVIGALPYAVAKKETYKASIILPYYKTIKDKWKYEVKYITSTIVTVGWRKQYAGLFSLDYKGVTVYFVDNEYYFGSDKIYGYGSYEAERSAFFNRAVLEMLRFMDVNFDVLHLNDWHTAMIALILKEQYIGKHEFEGFYDNIKTVFTIHNLKYQGIYEDAVLSDLFGLDHDYATVDKLEFFGSVNFMKGGLLYADAVTTVSKSYKDEICNPFFGENLDGILNTRKDVLYGIVNGLDEVQYNPKTDKMLYSTYGVRSMEGKKGNKKMLQKDLGLDEKPDVPLIAIITRLTSQKGLDLIQRVMDDIMSFNVQFVLLGTGDSEYENFFEEAASRYPGRLSAQIKFDEALSRKIYAASDMFLMPSLWEPCGISQLIAMRYGSIPIVRAVGGLKDTVEPYNAEENKGTGFVFHNYNAHEMAHTIYLACQAYKDSEQWRKLISRAMRTKYSWDKAADEYIEIYERITQ